MTFDKLRVNFGVFVETDEILILLFWWVEVLAFFKLSGLT